MSNKPWVTHQAQYAANQQALQAAAANQLYPYYGGQLGQAQQAQQFGQNAQNMAQVIITWNEMVPVDEREYVGFLDILGGFFTGQPRPHRLEFCQRCLFL